MVVPARGEHATYRDSDDRWIIAFINFITIDGIQGARFICIMLTARAHDYIFLASAMAATWKTAQSSRFYV